MLNSSDDKILIPARFMVAAGSTCMSSDLVSRYLPLIFTARLAESLPSICRSLDKQPVEREKPSRRL